MFDLHKPYAIRKENVSEVLPSTTLYCLSNYLQQKTSLPGMIDKWLIGIFLIICGKIRSRYLANSHIVLAKIKYYFCIDKKKWFP